MPFPSDFDIAEYAKHPYYEGKSLEDVAKDIHVRGQQAGLYKGVPYEDWAKSTGIKNQLDTHAQKQADAAKQAETQKYFKGRGVIGDVAATVSSGALGAVESAAHIVRGLPSTSGLLDRGATKTIEGIRSLQKEHPSLQLDPEAKGVGSAIERTVSGGIRSLPAIGASVVGGVVGGLAGPVGAAAGMGAGFGTAAAAEKYDEARERLIQGGTKPEDAEPIARREAMAEGVVAGSVGAALGPLGRAVAPEVEGTLMGLIKPTTKQLISKAGITTGLIGAQGAVGAGAGSEIEKRAGVEGAKGFWEAGAEALPESLMGGAIFGGLDALHITRVAGRDVKLLQDGEADPQARARVVAKVAGELNDRPDLLEKWYDEAGKAIEDNAPIPLDHRVADLQTRISNQETIPAEAQSDAHKASLEENKRKLDALVKEPEVPKEEPAKPEEGKVDASRLREDKIESPVEGIQREGVEENSGRDVHKGEGQAGEQGEKPSGEVAAQGLAEKPVDVAATHDYSSTQVNLPKSEADEVRKVAAKIPDADIYTDPKDPSFGREENPHVTVKYGLHTADPKEVEPLIKGIGPITAKIGKVSIFENDGFDVVKADVNSPQLHALNKKIAEGTKVTDTHPDYKPHVTIAYVKKGMGEKYIGDKSLEGKEITFDTLTFSGKDGKEHPFKLTGTPKTDSVSKESLPTPKKPAKPEPTGLRPAIRDGKDIHIGDEGGTHPDIRKANKLAEDTGESGFADKTGKFLSRAEAVEHLKTEQLAVFDKLPAKVRAGESDLHSEALIRASGGKAGEPLSLEDLRKIHEDKDKEAAQNRLDAEGERREQEGRDVETRCLGAKRWRKTL